MILHLDVFCHFFFSGPVKTKYYLNKLIPFLLKTLLIYFEKHFSKLFIG